DDDGGVLTPILEREPDDVRDSLAIAAMLVHRPEWHIGPIAEEVLWVAGSDAAGSEPRSGSTHGVASQALADTGYYVSRSPAGARTTRSTTSTAHTTAIVRSNTGGASWRCTAT